MASSSSNISSTLFSLSFPSETPFAHDKYFQHFLYTSSCFFLCSINSFLSTLDRHGLPSWLSGKESCQCRRHKGHRFDPWVGKIPWRRKWQPAQYSCLENPIDRGAWQAAVHRVAKSQTRLSAHACRTLDTVHQSVFQLIIILCLTVSNLIFKPSYLILNFMGFLKFSIFH